MIVAVNMLQKAKVAIAEGKKRVDVDAEALEVVAERALLVHPEPTPHFAKVNDIDTQVLHMVEEIGEVSKELRNYNSTINKDDQDMYRHKMASEIADSIISGYTALSILGYGRDKRSTLFKTIQERNKARGYYD